VSTTAAYPFVILAVSDSPYQTLGQLIEDARKRTGKLSYGHSGAGSALHLAGELLKAEAEIDLVHVPYKGGPQVLQELAAGRLDMAVGVPSSAMPLIKARRLRVLADRGQGEGVAVCRSEQTNRSPSSLPRGRPDCGLPPVLHEVSRSLTTSQALPSGLLQRSPTIS